MRKSPRGHRRRRSRRRDELALLTGLLEILSARGVDAEWHDDRRKLQEMLPHQWQVTLPMIIDAVETSVVGEC